MAKGDLKTDTISGYYEEEVFSKGLSREDTIERQVRIATYFYSKGMWDEFEYSCKALVSLLPLLVRDKVKIPDHNTSTKGVQDFYEMFVEIQNSLETDTNMIFKKKFIKTYE